jgi:hypothetical protein
MLGVFRDYRIELLLYLLSFILEIVGAVTGAPGRDPKALLIRRTFFVGQAILLKKNSFIGAKLLF